jgi:thiamine biosynthesis lipoprotein
MLLSLIMILGLSIWGCGTGSPDDSKTTATRLMMDTRVDLILYGADKKTSKQIAGEVFSEMEHLEKILSRTVAGGDLHRVNQAAGLEWVEISPELFFVLSKALEFAELTEGAFDPTVAPLLELWGFGTEHPRRPSEDELQKVLPLVDYRLVKLDKNRSMVFLTLEGMKLDLGGIAKGFIVDRGMEVIRKYSTEASFINAGGDIRLSGEKPSGEKWTVGVQDPRIGVQNSEAPCLAVLHLKGEGGVATSGDYQRFFEEDGVKYHHILDPADGKPARGLKSVTIVAQDALTADALSTAVFVLGEEGGLALLEQLPGVDGVLVDEEGKVTYSSGLEGKIELISPSESSS